MVMTSECAVAGMGHTEVHCVVPPGVGVGYTWTLTVAGQVSAPTNQSTGYAPPLIASAAVSGPGSFAGDPAGAPTSGGATVTLTGINFGHDPAHIRLTWNGIPATGLVLVTSHSQLRFTSPAGQGSKVMLVLTVAEQSVTLGPRLGPGGHGDADTGLLTYGATRVTRITLDKEGAPILPDCSSVGVDGRPTKGSLGAAVIVLDGSNFGNGSDLTVAVQGVPCSIVRSPMSTSLSTHVRIACTTQMCRGG